MRDPKFCVDCRHYVRRGPVGMTCDHGPLSLVTGKRDDVNPNDARAPYSNQQQAYGSVVPPRCGPEAKFFEPKATAGQPESLAVPADAKISMGVVGNFGTYASVEEWLAAEPESRVVQSSGG